jgi:tyrosinase
MNNCAFYGPHAYCHDSVGGVMSDVDTSPGDPLFFMHHGFIDHNWRIWQNINPNRVYAIGGSTTQNCSSSCKPTELNYVLSSYNFYPSVTVQQVMDTTGPYLCYRYDY